jgi:hypothetical protein
MLHLPGEGHGGEALDPDGNEENHPKGEPPIYIYIMGEPPMYIFLWLRRKSSKTRATCRAVKRSILAYYYYYYY